MKRKYVRSAEAIAKQKATNAKKKAKKHSIPLHEDRTSIYPPFPSIAGDHLPANAVDKFRNMRQEILQRAAEMLMEKLFS